MITILRKRGGAYCTGNAGYLCSMGGVPWVEVELEVTNVYGIYSLHGHLIGDVLVQQIGCDRSLAH